MNVSMENRFIRIKQKIIQDKKIRQTHILKYKFTGTLGAVAQF